MIAGLLRWVADRLDPPAPGAVAPPAAVASPLPSVFGDDRLDGQRREDALALLDPETYGYLLVLVRDHGTHLALDLHVALRDEMWPAMQSLLARVVLEADRVHGG